MYLRELTQPVTGLKGVGAATLRALSGLGIYTIADLLLHYPRDYQDRITERSLRESAGGLPANTTVTVIAHDYFGWGKRKTLKVWVEDTSGRAALICFGRNFLSETLIPGSQYRLYGQFSYRFGDLQTSSFDVEPITANQDQSTFFDLLLPIYPLTGNLSQALLRRIIKQAIDSYAKIIDDELPAATVAQYAFRGKAEALSGVHRPASREELEQSKRTLIYEELFYFQVAVAKRAAARAVHARSAVQFGGGLVDQLLERIPFQLTPDQKTAIDVIKTDMGLPKPMSRLLQGEVGSGKTLVAFCAALLPVERGDQVAIMAPTELLARQHAESAAKLLEPLGVRIAFLTGNLKAKGRSALLKALETGEVDIVVGTHALFTDEVAFKALCLVIVDEQHRFGVAQRAALMKKGGRDGLPPDLLLMTATPIPRTLALTAFGDLDISSLKTMPVGRLPVETHLAKEGNEQKVYDFVSREIHAGRQAYFVYPLIQQSEKIDLKDAESMYEALSKHTFPQFHLGLIHSKVPEDEKTKTMDRFVKGEIDILVATSVVEVGVDVPNASCIVVERAERFGLERYISCVAASAEIYINHTPFLSMEIHLPKMQNAD